MEVLIGQGEAKVDIEKPEINTDLESVMQKMGHRNKRWIHLMKKCTPMRRLMLLGGLFFKLVSPGNRNSLNQYNQNSGFVLRSIEGTRQSDI